MRKLCVISDTHNQLDRIKIPKCDLLIHAGDHTMGGTMPELLKAATNLRKLKESGICGKIICVAGNHDWGFEKDPYVSEYLFSDLGYLRDQATRWEGLKVWGAPWQPRFMDWAFNVNRNSEDLRQKWSIIPSDVDILITHGPPFGILDFSTYGNEHMGCELLRERLAQIRPKLHIFGHNHSTYGTFEADGTLYVNASTCTEQYKPTNPPIVVNWDGTQFLVDKTVEHRVS